MRKVLLTSACCFALGSAASASSIDGFNDWTDNGDGTFTILFDTLPADPGDRIAETVTFMDAVVLPGVTIEATSTGSDGQDGEEVREVNQDYPGNGGLGVEGAPDGDNMGPGEELKLSFIGATVDIVGFTLNGRTPGSGHQDDSNGIIDVNGSLFDASLWDGVGGDDTGGNLCEDIGATFCGLTMLTFAPQTGLTDANGQFVANPFNGYVESITFGNVSPVPVPAALPLLLAGMGGLGFMARRKRKAS